MSVEDQRRIHEWGSGTKEGHDYMPTEVVQDSQDSQVLIMSRYFQVGTETPPFTRTEGHVGEARHSSDRKNLRARWK